MAANPWDNDPIVSAAPAAAPAGGNPWDHDPIVSAAPAAAPPETVGRVAGLTGRALASGAAALPDEVSMLTSPLAYFAGKLTRNATGEEPIQPAGTPYKPQLSDFVHPDKWQQAAQYFADKAGAPTPQTPGERTARAA